MSSISEAYTEASIHNKHVTVIGGGVLGRRLCLMWCSTGKPVYLFDTSEKQADEAKKFVDENVEKQMQKMKVSSRGEMSISADLETAVKNAWMVIEAIPEILHLKIEIFAKLDILTDETCILATNSSSIKSSQIIGNVEHRYYFINLENGLEC
jgi:3-hydroxybutyryl-CoA dehydrogenase